MNFSEMAGISPREYVLWLTLGYAVFAAAALVAVLGLMRLAIELLDRPTPAPAKIPAYRVQLALPGPRRSLQR